jgi:acyl-coenzyme A thioesterase PaaI-like protein
MKNKFSDFIQPHIKANLLLKAFAISKVPLLFISGARVVSITEDSCCIEIPYRKIVKNHLGSLYFGAQAIGADACVGLLATDKIIKKNKNIHLIFKTFQANFLKRAEGPTQFICEQGPLIDQMIAETLSTKERVSQKIQAVAICQNETVSEFELELSLKAKD